MRCGQTSPVEGLARLVALVLVVVVVGACGPGANGDSGGDERRVSAVVVPIGAVVDDRVSRAGGDATDWKRFHIDSRDRVNIAIYWDDPGISAHMELRNAFGNLVNDFDHASDEGVDRFAAELDEGDYFLSIVAESGSSVYSLELQTGEVRSEGGGLGGMRPAREDDRPE